MDLKKIRQNLYIQMKERAMSLEQEVSSELQSYRDEQELLAQKSFFLSNKKELASSIKDADIIYLGDFHTFDQNSRNLLRILENFLGDKRNYAIGVEFIHHQHQIYIDSYLAGVLTEIEFLELVEYRESWHFPWSHYRAFFQLAKKNGLSIYALNSVGSLSERDLFAAKLIKKYSKDKKLFIFFGELHIISTRLPNQVQQLSPAKKHLIIHQNLDEVYWKLKPGNHIIKFSKDEYSLQTSPPWIKYESLLYWYENFDEDPEFDIHEHIMTEGALFKNDDLSDNFYELSFRITNLLKIPLSQNELEDFNIYDHQDLELISSKVITLNKNIQLLLEKNILSGELFHLPSTSHYYCSSYSFNRLTCLVGIHLFRALNKKRSILFEELEKNEQFIYLIMEKLISYFTSKLTNPYRKCNRYKDFTNDILLKIIDLDSPEKVNTLSKSLSLTDFDNIARDLGPYLGEHLYEKLFVQQNSESQFILDLIFENDYSNDLFFTILRSLLIQGHYEEESKRIF